MSLLCLPMQMQAQAQYQGSQTRHFLSLSAAGGMEIGMSGREMLRPGLGGDGQFAFSYEIQHEGLIFSIGVGADYRLMDNKLKQGMTHSFEAVDRDGYPMLYRYTYTSYEEMAHTLYATAPIWLGYCIKDLVYIAVGAKASLPLWNTYKTTAEMYTEGVYLNLIEPISQNVPTFAYYPTDTYTGTGKYNAPLVYVSPMLEVGANFHLDQKITCRVGAFVEYALPVVGKNNPVELVDYSAVNTNPLTRTQENLKQNIRFNPMMNSVMNAAAASQAGETMFKGWNQFLSFGVRATFSFDVTKTKPICRCLLY